MSWRIGDARAFEDALHRPTSVPHALRAREVPPEEIAAIVDCAERICALAATIEPSPAFAASLRSSLVAEAATALTQSAAPATVPAPPVAAGESVWVGTARLVTSLASQSRRRVAVVLAALVTSISLVGMTSASASALPGDSLYPVKRGVESVQLAFHRGDGSRGAFLLELANRRLAETNGLTQRTSAPPSAKADALGDYAKQADEGSDALVRAFTTGRDRDNIVTINQFATRAAAGLDALDGKLTGPAADSLDEAQDQLAAIVTMSARLCPDCGGIDPELVSALTTPAPSPAPAPAPSSPAPSPAAMAPAPAAKPSSATAEDEEAEEDEEVEESAPERKKSAAERNTVVQLPSTPQTSDPAPPQDNSSEGPTDGPTDEPTDEPTGDPTDDPTEHPDEPDDCHGQGNNPDSCGHNNPSGP
jgi:hypothetical protein